MKFVLTGQLIVLAYHAIANLDHDPVIAKWSVSPELFADHLDGLAEDGWSFVGLDEVVEGLAGERELPRRSVLLTFDDGYTDLLSDACPAMEKHGAPGVVFAVAGQTGGTNAWDAENGAESLALLDGDGLRAAAANGVEVGSHTMTHRPLRQVPEAELTDELKGSAARLEALGLPRPRAFSYPYGDFSPELASAVEAAGYSLAFTIKTGAVTRQGNRFLLPRVEVLGVDSARDLRHKVAMAGWPDRLRRRVLRLLRVNL